MLLIEGTNLDDGLVRVVRGPIRVGRIDAGREGRALFVELIIPGGARAGPVRSRSMPRGRLSRASGSWSIGPSAGRSRLGRTT